MNYTAVAESGKLLVQLLRSQLTPETVINPDHIGLCSPAEKGDLEVGIHLYDLKESEDFRQQSMTMADTSTQKYPSTYLSLYYMITAYSNGDIKYRSEEEQRILGKVVQVLADYPALGSDRLISSLPGGGIAPVLTMLNLSLEEKLRVWNVPNSAYKTSLFYKLGPLEIESARIRKAKRVVDIDMTVAQRGADSHGI